LGLQKLPHIFIYLIRTSNVKLWQNDKKAKTGKIIKGSLGIPHPKKLKAIKTVIT
tara:strand:+ start:75 stop:239 length:165 start_codon:yes stop_codon:yes gene_type:complete